MTHDFAIGILIREKESYESDLEMDWPNKKTLHYRYARDNDYREKIIELDKAIKVLSNG